MNVPVGPTTKVGWGAAATAFLGALLTYLTGDHSAKEVTALELGIGGGVILLVTHAFRYVQSIVGLKLPTGLTEAIGDIGGKDTAPQSAEAPPEGVVADGDGTP